MAHVTCRCGEILKVPPYPVERLTCPRCQAKIRLRRSKQAANGFDAPKDGYLRFYCPCGRRLKVRATSLTTAGKCPDCGRVVPFPASGHAKGTAPAGSAHPSWAPGADPEARTVDLDADDLQMLDEWSRRFTDQAQATGTVDLNPAEATPGHQSERSTTLDRAEPSPTIRMEAGLRVCVRCGSPLHMSATVCRACGEPAPPRGSSFP